MLRIALHCLDGDAVEEARQIMLTHAPSPTEARASVALPDLPACGVIKGNAFPLTPPSEICEFDLTEWPTGKVWEYFDTCTAGREIVAGPFRGKGYAFGTIDDIRAAFADRIGSSIERVPINDIDLRFEDGVISSLIKRSLLRAMALRAGVNTDGYGGCASRRDRQYGALTLHRALRCGPAGTRRRERTTSVRCRTGAARKQKSCGTDCRCRCDSVRLGSSVDDAISQDVHWPKFG
jgi:hypothetical protein